MDLRKRCAQRWARFGISTVSGIRAHTPREDVIRLTRELSHADGVVTIGGGSVCDAVKAARLCLANGVTEAAEMDRLSSHRVSDGAALPVISPSLPFIAIPTTLSAAEFTSLAGVTDERGPRKEGYDYPGMAPNIVVLDPAMTIGTPSRLWFGTGMRAIDHAVETWCSVNATPLSDASSLYAARILIHALERTQRDSDDLQARQDCLEGAWLSIQGASAGGKCWSQPRNRSRTWRNREDAARRDILCHASTRSSLQCCSKCRTATRAWYIDRGDRAGSCRCHCTIGHEFGPAGQVERCRS